MVLIKNGTILTQNRKREIIENGAIIIQGDQILDIGKTEDIEERYKSDKVIDAQDKIVMPGLINTHAHAAMSLFKGFADDLPLKEWLEKYIWPNEAKYINPVSSYWGTCLAILEMVYSGTTTFCDMYFFEDEVAQACKKIGIRAVLSEGLLDSPTPNCKTPQQGLVYTEKFIKKYIDDNLIKPATGPHSAYTLSSVYLKKAANFLDYYDISYHIHIAETKDEVKKVKKEHKSTPLGYLEKIGVLNDKIIAAHCVYLNKDDIRNVKKYDIGIAHCPCSNMKLASGIAPVPEILNSKIKLGLGTDGSASNNNLDMLEEAKAVALLHKINTGKPEVVSAQQVTDIATIGGAKVLGLEDQIGSLEKEKKADIIILDFQKPHLMPCYNIYSHLIYSAFGSDVQTVMINGKVVMEDRKILTIDENEVLEKVQKITQLIKKRN